MRITPLITDHARERAKERLGWNHSALDRMAERALNEGVAHTHTRGRLNRYLGKLYMERKKANNTRLYGEHVFIFSNEVLITVFPLPREMRAAAQKASKRLTPF